MSIASPITEVQAHVVQFGRAAEAVAVGFDHLNAIRCEGLLQRGILEIDRMLFGRGSESVEIDRQRWLEFEPDRAVRRIIGGRHLDAVTGDAVVVYRFAGDA